MRKLRLCVCKRLHKFLDSDGDWDGIYDGEGIEVAGMDGYDTEEAAERAGEMRLNELIKRYESQN